MTYHKQLNKSSSFDDHLILWNHSRENEKLSLIQQYFLLNKSFFHVRFVFTKLIRNMLCQKNTYSRLTIPNKFYIHIILHMNDAFCLIPYNGHLYVLLWLSIYADGNTIEKFVCKHQIQDPYGIYHLVCRICTFELLFLII